MNTATPTRPGHWLVGGLLILGVAAAGLGIWFQRQQTGRCLSFYGADAARRIASAPEVSLMLVGPGGSPGRLQGRRIIDVTRSPGLVHLRRGLVEDANFSWPPDAAAGSGAVARLPAEEWDVAFVFREPDRGGRGNRPPVETTVVIALPRDEAESEPHTAATAPEGAVAVVGQPGRLGLGRIGKGLATWIRTTLEDGR